MGKLIAYSSIFVLFILDIFSLILLAGTYGIGWAFAAFFLVPAQLFVPFLVGTWLPMLVLMAILFLGLFLDSRESKN
jgi:hypothetical protein